MINREIAKSTLKIHPQICPMKVKRIVKHPVYDRESAHRYFHRPFRERNRKDEEEEEEEVKGSRDATSRSRDVYITSPYTHAAVHERGRRGRGRRGTKMISPLFPVSGLSHRGPYGVSAGGWAVSTYYKLAARRPPSLT